MISREIFFDTILSASNANKKFQIEHTNYSYTVKKSSDQSVILSVVADQSIRVMENDQKHQLSWKVLEK